MSKKKDPKEILEEAELTVEEQEETADEKVEFEIEPVDEEKTEAEEDKKLEEPKKIVPKPEKQRQNEQTEQEKKTGFILITGIIVLAIIMAFATFYAFKDYKVRMAEEAAAAAARSSCHHINAHGYKSWSIHYRMGATAYEYYYLDENGKEIKVGIDEVTNLAKQQIAYLGDDVLDNRLLLYYYADALSEFESMYSSYLAYIMDTTAPFDSQLCTLTEDGSMTWQQYFIQLALDRYHTTMAMVLEAQAKGFTLSEEDQTAYDEEMQNLDWMAMSYGYPDTDTFVKAALGATASADSYKQYMYDTIVATAYMEYLTEQIEITPEQLDAYYDAHEADFAAQYITKDETNVVNVRHVLIQPTAGEDGTVSDAAWAEAEKEAKNLLKEWKAGEATEESFAEMAMTYSTDSGSVETGGLYENIYPGQMVEPFEAWCFDESRETGDTGIVKTDYGYHIMYFVSEGDQAYWQIVCEESILAEEIEVLRTDILGKYEIDIRWENIMILDATPATLPVADQTVTVTETDAQ